MKTATIYECAIIFSFLAVVQAVISPHVFIIDYFIGEQNVWLGIPEFNLLEQNITIPGLSMTFPDIHCTTDGAICQLITGEGEINAAASTLALTLSPEFDLTRTYFLLAGIGGINPEVGTLASVTFAQFAVQVALQHEFDARERPEGFSTGYVPLGTTTPNTYPRFVYGTEVFQLNDALRQRAMQFANTASLSDSESAQAHRRLYANASGAAAALLPPSIIACDAATSDNWFSGSLLGHAIEDYTKLITKGAATYCTSQQEDNAVLESFLRGHLARRVDFSRVVIMRAGSNFDRPPPGMSAAENLFHGMQGLAPALMNLYLAGVKVVQGILAGWDDSFAVGIPAQNYVGDIFGSLGGRPSYGPGSIFDGKGALQPVPQESDTVTCKTTDATPHIWFSGAFGVGLAFVLGISIGLFARAV